MDVDTVPALISRHGYVGPVEWMSPVEARALSLHLATAYSLGRWDIVRNPHRREPWARAIVTAAALARPVRAMLGRDVCVENSFLIIKWPGAEFVVPPHQDGIDDRIELDPARAVSCWVAISDADATSGCLEVVVGSHARYLPFEPESVAGQPGRGRGLTIAHEYVTRMVFDPVPLTAGQAVLFDVRLVHRSHSNTGPMPRIGLNIRYTTPDGFRRGTPTGRSGWMPLALP